MPPSSKSSTKIVPPKQTASDEITFESKEADIVRLLVATIVEFFENTKSHPYIREKRTGKFLRWPPRSGYKPNLSQTLDLRPLGTSYRNLFSSAMRMENIQA